MFVVAKGVPWKPGFTAEYLEQLANGQELFIHDGIAYCDRWVARAQPGGTKGRLYPHMQKRAARMLDYCQRYIDNLDNQVVCRLKTPARYQDSNVIYYSSTYPDFTVGMDANAAQILPSETIDVYGVIYGDVDTQLEGAGQSMGLRLTAKWLPCLVAVSQGRVLAVEEALPKPRSSEQIKKWIASGSIPVFGAPLPTDR